jgi:hypothetical protein
VATVVLFRLRLDTTDSDTFDITVEVVYVWPYATKVAVTVTELIAATEANGRLSTLLPIVVKVTAGVVDQVTAPLSSPDKLAVTSILLGEVPEAVLLKELAVGVSAIKLLETLTSLGFVCCNSKSLALVIDAIIQALLKLPYPISSLC